MKKENKKQNKKIKKKSEFYSITSEQEKLIKEKEKLKETNSPYFYGGMTAGAAAIDGF